MRLVTLALLMACTEAPEEDRLGYSDVSLVPVEVRVMLDGAPRAGGGDLLVQVEYDETGSVDLPAPTAEGLEFTPNGLPTVEDLGAREVVTQRFIYAGRRGNYEITPITVTWESDGSPGTERHEATSTPVFVDIEADPITPEGLELGDIAEPAAIWRIPWGPILGVATLFLAGLAAVEPGELI